MRDRLSAYEIVAVYGYVLGAVFQALLMVAR